MGRLCHDGAVAKLEYRDETEMETLRWKTSVFQAIEINFGTVGEAILIEEFSTATAEAILARLDHICGISGAFGADRWPSTSTALCFS